VLHFDTPPNSLFLQTPSKDKTEVFPVALSEENMNMFDAGIMDSSIIIVAD
jgi:hypothetical protein